MEESYVVVSYRLIGLIPNNNYEAPLRIMFSYCHNQYVWVGVGEDVRGEAVRHFGKRGE